MQMLLAVNAGCFLAIALLTLTALTRRHKEESPTNTETWLAAAGAGYLILSFISLLWLLKFLTYSQRDFELLMLGALIIQTISFWKIAQQVQKDKTLLYTFIGYIASIILSIFLLVQSKFVISIISLIFFSVICLRLSNLDNKLKSASNWGILYSLLYVLMQSLYLLDIGNILWFSVFVCIPLFVFLFLIISKLHELDIIKYKKDKPKEESSMLKFLKIFIFILVLTNLVFISTINIHEFGHLISAKSQGCEVRIVLYESGTYPHTESFCPDGTKNAISILSGLLFPIIIAILILLIGGIFMKELALLSIGLNLIASSNDLQNLGMNQNISGALVITGVILTVASILWLSKAKIQQETS